MKNKKLYFAILLGVFSILFVGFLAVKVIPNVFVTLTKAAPAAKISMVNSYLIGGRILAKANGIDKCVVNVFVLDASDKGIKGVPVELSGMDGGELQSLSGVDGKAVFELTSEREGQFTLTAAISGSSLDNTIKVTFRN